MSLHEDSDQDGDDIPWGPEVTEDLRIHLTSIKDTNKNLRKKVVDLSTHIAGIEDRLNVRLTTSDRERDDSLRVVTESLNRLTAVVQRLEARDATPRQSQSPQRRQGQSGEDFSDVSDARGGHRRQPRRGVEVRHAAGQRRNQGGDAAQEDGGLGRIKVTIPEFSGRSDPEKYLEWEMRVNQIFYGHNYSEEKKVRVASMEFTEYALVWWDNKNRTGERPATWVDLKRVMREVFVPAYYTRQLHSKLRRLVQGTKSVDEYYKEMQILMIRTAVRESPEATMVRFFEGLEEKIRDRVDLMQYNDIHELLHQAGRAERWVLEKQSADIRPSYNSGRRSSSHVDDGKFNAKPAVSSKSMSIEHSKVAAASKEVSQSASSTSHHSNIICHKCGGRGHIMRECPNRKTILLVDDAYISDSEDEMPPLEDDTTNDDGTALDAWPALNVPSLMAHKVQRDDMVIVEPGQRRSIFQTACTIKGEICKLIVDGGSASNMISKDVVESLSLPTWEHPKPYYMQWINSVGKLKVTHRVKVPFAVDEYTDKVECNVLPLHRPKCRPSYKPSYAKEEYQGPPSSGPPT
nr:uncharacterized protein LOC127315589 [Lolium perenne]